jgi:hypothetical protein
VSIIIIIEESGIITYQWQPRDRHAHVVANVVINVVAIIWLLLCIVQHALPHLQLTLRRFDVKPVQFEFLQTNLGFLNLLLSRYPFRLHLAGLLLLTLDAFRSIGLTLA